MSQYSVVDTFLVFQDPWSLGVISDIRYRMCKNVLRLVSNEVFVVMEVLALIGLIILNGIFAMSEIALVTARKPRLMKLAAEGDTSAGVALRLAEEPTKFLSTIQIGITSIGVLNGIVGEALFAEPLSAWLQSLGLSESTSHMSATAAVVVLVTYVTIVVGELVPKRIGQLSPEMIARIVAPPHEGVGCNNSPLRCSAFCVDPDCACHDGYQANRAGKCHGRRNSCDA